VTRLAKHGDEGRDYRFAQLTCRWVLGKADPRSGDAQQSQRNGEFPTHGANLPPAVFTVLDALTSYLTPVYRVGHEVPSP
jgi:hypothetical protein